MYPKLKPEPVTYFSSDGEKIRLPRRMIAAAYAGCLASRYQSLWESNPLTAAGKTFKDYYEESMPWSIEAANKVGLSAVAETLEYHRPDKGTDDLLKDRIEHSDNPYYPFLEEDE